MLGSNYKPSDDQTGNGSYNSSVFSGKSTINNSNTANNTSISTKDIHLLIDKLKWKKYDFLQYCLYLFYSLITCGFFALFCFLYPNYKFKFLTIDCSPNESDIAIVCIDNNESISTCEHYYTPPTFTNNSTSNSGKREHAVIVECECIRFCASSVDNYIVRQIPIIPMNFHRFFSLNYETTGDENDILQEYTILTTQYGYNRMKVPESTFLEIAIRHLLSPFYLFQYFAVIIWYYEEYWLFASLILFITLSAVYFTTVESVHNLEQLRQLVGTHHNVKVINSRYHTLSRASAAIQDSIPQKMKVSESPSNRTGKILLNHASSNS